MRKEKKKFQNIVAAWRIMGLNFSKNTLESYGIENFYQNHVIFWRGSDVILQKIN